MIDAAGDSPRIHARGVEPFSAPGTIVLVIGGPLAPSKVLGLCASLHLLLEGSDRGLVVCDLGRLDGQDAGTVDALARLQLTARRLGRQIRLRNASSELQELVALMGLCDALPIRETDALPICET